MFGFLILVQVIVCVLLVVVVLMQASKGGGLAGTFGGGSVGMAFGVRRTSDFLTRATQVLAGIFMVLSLVINMFFLPRIGGSDVESVLQRESPVPQGPVTPQLPPTLPPATTPKPGN
ncbi:MAG: preprotein translocase subunit SecG [Ignavibacteria bacterium]|nr:preprotein translocase subunit SecG [Ignavibacteria bacterium]